MIEIKAIKWQSTLPSEGRGRRFESFRVRHISQALSDKFQPAQTGQNRTKPVYRVTVLARIGGCVAGLFLAPGLALGADSPGLAFDPHVLLLAWPDARQETVAATSRETCTAAIGSIIAGRWLADDPPAVMRCERGSAFAPGSDCIQGYNCGDRQ